MKQSSSASLRNPVPGIFLAGSPFLPMDNISKIRNEIPGANSLITVPDYSAYTLVELFRARYWIETERATALEKEIQKRCEHIREQTSRSKTLRAVGSSTRFRPYGLICGVVLLCLCLGPFVSVKFLDTVNLVKDVNGDNVSLSGIWAVVMLPIVVIVAMIGGRMDSERVINWFDLNGRKHDLMSYCEKQQNFTPLKTRFAQLFCHTLRAASVDKLSSKTTVSRLNNRPPTNY